MKDKMITEHEIVHFEKSMKRAEKSRNTIQKYMRDVRKLQCFAEGKKLTKDVMVAYKKQLQISGNYKISSINSFLTAANHFCNVMGWHELCVHTVKVQRKVFESEEKELTKPEYRRLVRAAMTYDEKTALIMQTLASTGIRIGDEHVIIRLKLDEPSKLVCSPYGRQWKYPKIYHMRSIFMSRKKFSKEFKLKLLKEHDENGISYWKLGKEYGIEASIIRRWGYVYATFGEAGLEKHNSDQCNYSAEFKQMVVTEYLEGKISIQDLAYKHKILAPSTVRTWIKQYNNHEELTNSRKEGVHHMVKNNSRKNTTFEERVRIVEECISTGCDYTSIAIKYECSYGQVYSWVKKYQAKGIDGLYDRRGKNKIVEELSEIEKLKIENRLLKAQTKKQQMEIDFLKKLDEIERR